MRHFLTDLVCSSIKVGMQWFDMVICTVRKKSDQCGCVLEKQFPTIGFLENWILEVWIIYSAFTDYLQLKASDNGGLLSGSQQSKTHGVSGQHSRKMLLGRILLATCSVWWLRALRGFGMPHSNLCPCLHMASPSCLCPSCLLSYGHQPLGLSSPPNPWYLMILNYICQDPIFK